MMIFLIILIQTEQYFEFILALTMDMNQSFQFLSPDRFDLRHMAFFPPSTTSTSRTTCQFDTYSVSLIALDYQLDTLVLCLLGGRLLCEPVHFAGL